MSTKKEQIKINNIEIDVLRKDIKNMHLAVYPPNGRIRLAAPEKTDPEVLRLFAISKLGWIKKHVKNFKEQKRESPRQYVPGESHYFHGRRYLLDIIQHDGYNDMVLNGTKKMKMYVRSSTSQQQRERIMREWYRKRLKEQIPDLIRYWEEVIGVKCDDWGVKLMRTKWGSSNPDQKRIWLNLELAKKPPMCLEYIIVHELVHLLERHHNNRFIAYMDKFMPRWRLYRDQLNELPVARGEWGY